MLPRQAKEPQAGSSKRMKLDPNSTDRVDSNCPAVTAENGRYLIQQVRQGPMFNLRLDWLFSRSLGRSGCKAGQQDMTFVTMSNLNATVFGLRHRATGTLYVSPLLAGIQDQPSLPMALLGNTVAAFDDARKRAEKWAEDPADDNPNGDQGKSYDAADGISEPFQVRRFIIVWRLIVEIGPARSSIPSTK
jgi:hypothetical protein